MEDKRLIVAENDMSYALLCLKESIDYFISCYEKALEEVKGKTPNVVKITSQDVRVCAEQLRQDARLREKTKGKETDDETDSVMNAGTDNGTDSGTNNGPDANREKNVKTGTNAENETAKKDKPNRNVRRKHRRKKKPGTGTEAS